jgi:hypothetical protein
MTLLAGATTIAGLPARREYGWHSVVLGFCGTVTAEDELDVDGPSCAAMPGVDAS